MASEFYVIFIFSLLPKKSDLVIKMQFRQPVRERTLCVKMRTKRKAVCLFRFVFSPAVVFTTQTWQPGTWPHRATTKYTHTINKQTNKKKTLTLHILNQLKYSTDVPSPPKASQKIKNKKSGPVCTENPLRRLRGRKGGVEGYQWVLGGVNRPCVVTSIQ